MSKPNKRSQRRNLPNFLFIGADKSGSTWLYEILRRHPHCFTPRAKDLYFFDRYYDKGIDWYARFFSRAPKDALAIGELSHDYLYSEAAAVRIARDLPGVRLVVFLRDPVERCFSEYLYLIRNGLTCKPLRQAVLDRPEILEHSRYARHLGVYQRRFDHEHLGIFFFDHLVANPARVAESVLNFIGLDWTGEIDASINPLPASRPRSQFVARVASHGARSVRRLGFPSVVGRVKTSQLARRLYMPYTESDRPHLTDDDRAFLCQELEHDTRALGGMVQGDLPTWILTGLAA